MYLLSIFYEIVDFIVIPKIQKMMPKRYSCPDHFDKEHICYKMKKLDIMSDMDKKLVIEWVERIGRDFNGLIMIKRSVPSLIKMKLNFLDTKS